MTFPHRAFPTETGSAAARTDGVTFADAFPSQDRWQQNDVAVSEDEAVARKAGRVIRAGNGNDGDLDSAAFVACSMILPVDADTFGFHQSRFRIVSYCRAFDHSTGDCRPQRLESR